MQTYLDCIPCFFRQGLTESRLVGSDEADQKRVLNKIAELIPNLPLHATPPEMALTVHELIVEVIKEEDPYKEIKKMCNDEALALFSELKKRVDNAANPLLRAVELSIAGNIIDYGANADLDLQKELDLLIKQEEDRIKNESTGIFAFPEFKDAVIKGKTILIIGDNAGEIVFDRFLMQAIQSINKEASIIYAVREKAILNDATREDALYAGINNEAEIISSGCPAPGTIISLCSEEFCTIFNDSDVIISKGQGNFEGLSDVQQEIFFLFRAKCQVIAREINGKVGDFVLYHKRRQ